jgi:hypothetical protein
MQTISVHKSGLAFGALLGVWHLLWAALVAFGFAQSIIDFVFWMHFIKPIYVIGPFHIGTAVLLVAVTSVIGYLMGLLFAAVWNFLHK